MREEPGREFVEDRAVENDAPGPSNADAYCCSLFKSAGSPYAMAA